MNQPTQYKMEVYRQSKKCTVGMVPVNQKDFVLEDVSVCLESRCFGEVQMVSLHLELQQETHWILDGLEQNAPIHVHIPMDPKPEKMTALYLFSDWWTRPAFAERFEDIPPRTQVLLLKEKDRCACLVPMVGRQWKAVLNGGDETSLHLELYCGVGGCLQVDEPLYILSEGATVTEAVHNAFVWLSREKGIPLRPERRMPEEFRYLGWCSWNAFYTDVNETGLRQKAAELTAKRVPVRWMLIDDGWMSTEGTRLTGFAPDAEKFPQGFLAMAEDIRKSSSVQTFGVWHAFGGYWNGIQMDSELAQKEASHLISCVNGSLVPSPEHGMEFYYHWYQLLRKEGITFVKVDGQSMAARYFENTLPLSRAVRGMNEALESGSVLMDNSIINCMGMAMENILARPASCISRNSDDFFPDREGSFSEHLLENAYNAIYHDELYCCDWDMFWTSHPDSKKHALLRAISGGPVYFSDRIGETDPEVLRPLVYPDGRILMMSRSARPTEDCIFEDPLKNGVLKLHNAALWGSGMAGGIAVYNLTKETQTFSFAPEDIPELESAERYWVYDWMGKSAATLDKDQRFEGILEGQGFGWYVILPVKDTLSCLGLSEKYAGLTAVENVLETSGCTTVILRASGTVSWLSERSCRLVEWNGEDVTRLVEKNGAVFTLPREEQSAKAVLCIRW